MKAKPSLSGGNGARLIAAGKAVATTAATAAVGAGGAAVAVVAAVAEVAEVAFEGLSGKGAGGWAGAVGAAAAGVGARPGVDSVVLKPVCATALQVPVSNNAGAAMHTTSET